MPKKKIAATGPTRQLTYCWSDDSRVHILDGARCMCLMPSAAMANVSAQFPTGGKKECTSCRSILKSRNAFDDAITTPSGRVRDKEKAKAFLKRQKGYAKPDGFTKLPKGCAKEFYASPEWKALRFDALKKNDGRCELCGSSKHDGAVLHVDHIKPRSKYPKMALDPHNLQVLCEPCNMGKGNRCTKDWRGNDAA